MCDNPTKLKTLFVPLVEADIPGKETLSLSQVTQWLSFSNRVGGEKPVLVFRGNLWQSKW